MHSHSQHSPAADNNNNNTYSFIPVKTERSTLQSVTQDSDYIHVASAYAATQDSNHDTTVTQDSHNNQA